MPTKTTHRAPQGRQAASRTMDVDTLWQLERLGAPSLSPDGAQVVVSATRYAMDENKGRSRLLLLSTLGGAPRELTAMGEKDGQPAWSPRGDLIAFVAQREQDGVKDEEPQLWLIAPDGGEARRAVPGRTGEDADPPGLPTGVLAFRWFADGRRIAYLAWVWPGLGGTPRVNAQRQREKLKAWKARKESGLVTSEAFYRYWDHHLPQDREVHLFVLDLASGQSTDLCEGLGIQLPRADPDALHFDIAPDGRRLCLVHDAAGEQRIDHHLSLSELELPGGRGGGRGGKPRLVTLVDALGADAAWDCGAPRYAPDGNQIAFLAAERGRKDTLPPQLAVWRRAAQPGQGAAEPAGWSVVSAAWDHAVEGPLVWEDDGQALLLLAEDRGSRRLWRWDLADGRAEPVHPLPAAAGATAAGAVGATTSMASSTSTRAASRGTATRRHAAAPGAELGHGSGWVSGHDKQAGCTVVTVETDQHPAQVLALLPGQAPRRIDASNDALLAPLTLGASRVVEVTGALGDAVQMRLTFPPGIDPDQPGRRKLPVLHLIHGGPHACFGDQWHYRWNPQVFAAQGYVVACVNYHGSSGFGFAFLDAITHRWGELELQDVEAATDWLRAQPWVDAEQVYAGGGSYGGYMVAWMNGHVPYDAKRPRYRAYVCHAGCFDWVGMFADDAYTWHGRELGAWYWADMAKVHAQSPHAFAGQMATPTLVIHGALDYRVPDAQGLAYYNTLKARGIDARLLWFPDENHWVLKPRNSQLWYAEFLAWLQRHAPRPAAKRGKAATVGTTGQAPRQRPRGTPPSE